MTLKARPDLSRLAGSREAVTDLLVREHYTWELLAPDPNDQSRIKQPGNFRAETHDRIVAPLYPLVFMIVAYAYLGEMDRAFEYLERAFEERAGWWCMPRSPAFDLFRSDPRFAALASRVG